MDVPRIGGKHRAVGRLRARGFADCFEREAQIVEHAGMSRRAHERPLVARDGRCMFAAFVLAVGEMEQCFRVIGIESERLPVRSFCGSGLALR
jgi:hypothetical protein